MCKVSYAVGVTTILRWYIIYADRLTVYCSLYFNIYLAPLAYSILASSMLLVVISKLMLQDNIEATSREGPTVRIRL